MTTTSFKPLLRILDAPTDAAFAHELLVTTGTDLGPPDRGVFLTRQAALGILSRSGLAPFVIGDPVSGRRLGVAWIDELDLRSQHCRVRAVVPSETPDGLSILCSAYVELSEYLFAAFPIKKVYAHIPDEALCAELLRLHPDFTLEGRLRSHAFVCGEFTDVAVVSRFRVRGSVSNRWTAIDESDS